ARHIFRGPDRRRVAPRAICTKFAEKDTIARRSSSANTIMANLDMARGQSRENKIKLHGAEAFRGMRKAGQLAAEALDLLVQHVRPGVTPGPLDDLVVDFALQRGAIPAPLNYRGFPKAICTSVNHVVCHGIPNSKPLKDGDIINIDVTLILDG